jgi:uncharacterized protein
LLGFRVYRVRYHDKVARIEVAPEELPRLLAAEIREEIAQRFKESGFLYVTVDLQGYRTGSLNEGQEKNGEKFKVSRTGRVGDENRPS